MGNSSDTITYMFIFVAIGIIEAFASGYNIIVGGAVGAIAYFSAVILGLFPITGQIAYKLFMDYVFSHVGFSMPFVYWIGMILNILVSVAVLIILLAIFRGDKMIKSIDISI